MRGSHNEKSDVEESSVETEDALPTAQQHFHCSVLPHVLHMCHRGRASSFVFDKLAPTFVMLTKLLPLLMIMGKMRAEVFSQMKSRACRKFWCWAHSGFDLVSRMGGASIRVAVDDS